MHAELGANKHQTRHVTVAVGTLEVYSTEDCFVEFIPIPPDTRQKRTRTNNAPSFACSHFVCIITTSALLQVGTPSARGAGSSTAVNHNTKFGLKHIESLWERGEREAHGVVAQRQQAHRECLPVRLIMLEQERRLLTR